MATAMSLWHDTPARQAIVDYVAAVTDQKSAEGIFLAFTKAERLRRPFRTSTDIRNTVRQASSPTRF